MTAMENNIEDGGKGKENRGVVSKGVQRGYINRRRGKMSGIPLCGAGISSRSVKADNFSQSGVNFFVRVGGGVWRLTHNIGTLGEARHLPRLGGKRLE